MTQILKFKSIAKDCLFYSQWQYCISFQLDEVSALKNLDHEYINALIERRKMWRGTAQQRWITSRLPSTPLPVMNSNRRRRIITEETVTDLHNLADILRKTKIPYKLVTSSDHGWIYTNSKRFIKRLSGINALLDQQYTEAIIARPKNTIVLKEPKHTHRTYLKSLKLTPYEKQSLANFFINQIEHIRTSPSLAKWLLMPFHRTQDYFFVDHNGEGWLIMLALVKSGIIRKTVEIVTA